MIIGLSLVKLVTQTNPYTSIPYAAFFLVSKSSFFLRIIQKKNSWVIVWCPISFQFLRSQTQTVSWKNCGLCQRKGESVAFSFSALITASFLSPCLCIFILRLLCGLIWGHYLSLSMKTLVFLTLFMKFPLIGLSLGHMPTSQGLSCPYGSV